jgi:hypothetical protein
VLARTLLLLGAIVASLPAAAIVMRPDRDDAEYLELASRYASAVALGSYGEGALIAPRWILTSADVARAMREAKGSLRLRIGGQDQGVQSVITPPAGSAGDIALILLREPVTDVETTPIYRASDEHGKALVIAAHGAAARMGSDTVVRDGRKRAAINTVDRVDAGILAMKLKAPDDASDMQGAAGPGDEGAPAFIEANGRLLVAGIAQGPRGGNVPKVGDWDVYTRVSASAAWIDDAMFKAAAEEAAATSRPLPSPRRRGSAH